MMIQLGVVEVLSCVEAREVRAIFEMGSVMEGKR